MKKIVIISILLFILLSIISAGQTVGSVDAILDSPKSPVTDQNATFIADFIGFPLSGITPLNVQFEDKTNTNTVAWEWDFNSDGKIDSKEKNPAYIFVKPGKYAVTLKVSNGEMWKNTSKNDYIIVVEKPEANFTAFPRVGKTPLSVQFTDTSTGNISSWLWDFGDGAISTLQNPNHIYTNDGTYKVSLKVSNSFGFNITEIPSFINVSSTSVPKIDFESNINSGKAPLTVQFRDLSSGEHVAWEWDFNSDGKIDSKEKDPIYEYKYPGRYTVTLRINNGTIWDTFTKPDYILVENNLKASFTASSNKGIAPLSVQFTDTSTGNISYWFWDFGDGDTSTMQNPNHTYSNPGKYIVKLKISSSFDLSSSEASSLIEASSPQNPPVVDPPVVDPPNITPTPFEPPIVNPPVVVPTPVTPPIIEPPSNDNNLSNDIPPPVNPPITSSSTIDFSSNITSGKVPLIIQFEDISNENLIGWQWDFNSDSIVDSTEKNPLCEFKEPGNYTVTLKGNNGTEWGIVTKTDYIKVTYGIQADFIATPVNGWVPLTVQFNDTSAGDIGSWFWDFGDGNTSTLQNPNHTYFNTGVYSVSLNVSDLSEYNVLTWNNYINVYDADYSTGGGGGSNIGGRDYIGGSAVGGGGSPEPTSNIEAKEISQKFVVSGNLIKFEFPQKATNIDFIEFDAKKTLGKTTTIIEQLKGKSVLTPAEPGGKVHKYINIWVGNEGVASPENIENAVIGFKVNKAEVILNETEKSTVKLQRYSQGKWNVLNTDKVAEDDQYIYFQAKTPGFSPFSITVGNIELFEYTTIEKNQSAENSGPNIESRVNQSNESQNISLFENMDWEKTSNSIRIVIIAMVVLFIGLAIKEKLKK